MSDEIQFVVSDLLSHLDDPPLGFECVKYVKDNNHGNTSIYPSDAKKWDDVEKVIITEDISETHTYTYRRK